MEELIQKYYVAGFFSYELGYLLEDVFKYKKKTCFPYALFCAYEKPLPCSHHHDAYCNYTINNLSLNISKHQYLTNLKKIKDYISCGDIYQANYTMKYKFDFKGSALGLYLDLKQKQNAAYNVFAKCGDYHILSLSPELFFYKNRNYLKVKPMKGTLKRGRNITEDKKNILKLINEKNRSENVMIVDLLRNDLSKISEYNSVKVTKMFEIEQYNTLFQMTSTIKSRAKKNLSLYELVKGIFPSGSVTGAPKIRSMEIIKDLEKEERKIYTGSIGFFLPRGGAKFNVAIRTVLIHKNRGEMGVGGGIVYDSEAEDEFRECNLKAEFLINDPVTPFKLIETILFDRNYKYLNLHLKRLKESAGYFNFKFNRKEILLKLLKIKTLLKNKKYKIRILMDKDGKAALNYEKINAVKKNYRITISPDRINSNDIFYFHKTTNRKLYDKELKRVRNKGFFDVIFLNERDEITEGAITNIFIEKDEILYTPPVECGLLNGIMRQAVISKYKIKEKIIKLKDLKNADAVYISNSIIGFQESRVICNYD